MSREEESARACHRRHIEVAAVLSSFLESQAEVPSEVVRYLEALNVSMTPAWADLSCAHFHRWLWQLLLDHMDDLSRYKDNRVIESTLERWYDVSGEMILRGPHLHDPRNERIDRGTWAKVFADHLSSANPPIPATLLKYFVRHPLIVSEPHAPMLFECLSALANTVLGKHPELQEEFLWLVINTAAKASDLGWHLLDDAVTIVGKNPAGRLRLLTRLIKNLGAAPDRDRLISIHRRVDRWVDDQEDKTCEAQMRRDQEELVPLLLGHDRRNRRLSTLLAPNWVKADVRVGGDAAGEAKIFGTVRDVSGGPPSTFGRGIHIHAADWTFDFASDTASQTPRTLVATRRDSAHGFRLKEAKVELSYGARLNTSLFDAGCVRGFAYKPKYGLPGGGLVLWLDDSSGDFQRWRDFVVTLDDLNYEDQVG
jgi:hypothetical protein